MHVILMHTQIVPSIYILHGLCIISDDQVIFQLPQANGYVCVDFGFKIDGLF